MEKLKQELPLLQNNRFLNNFESDYDLDNKFYGVKFDGSFKLNPRAKEQFTKDIERLIYNPEIYIPEYNAAAPTEKHKSLVTRIKAMGINLIMNNFLTSGFNITPQSYHDLIPARYLTQKQDVDGRKISISDYMQELTFKMQDESFFKGSDLITYMSMFGGMKSEGIPLLGRVKNKFLKGDTFTLTSTKDATFIFSYNPKTYESSTFVDAGLSKSKKKIFLRLKPMFKSKKVYTIPGMSKKLRESKIFTSSDLTYEEAYNNVASGLDKFYSTKADIDFMDDQEDDNSIETCTTT